MTVRTCILVTGAGGFVGRNLCAALGRRADLDVVRFDVADEAQVWEDGLRRAETIFHLAGVNRPDNPAEFQAGNADLTARLCARLAELGRSPKVVLASSIQAEQDNPYGRSKRGAEEALRRYTQATGGEGVVHRFRNLFGKWCRPNYNSVTATFCHNLAHGLPIEVSDPARALSLTYIDDVVAACCAEIGRAPATPRFRMAPDLPSRQVTLGELAALIRSFRTLRTDLLLPALDDVFVRRLYATYLSYLDPAEFGYGLVQRQDARGSLAEFLKHGSAGQIFVSRTRPGVTRGNHYHHTKTEKFLVVEGRATIRLRRIDCAEVHELCVQGTDFRVVDIPPGYTHSITNTGDTELVTLFWASEIFDPQAPDTFSMEVKSCES